MGSEQFEQLKGGIVKRKQRRRLGLFVDGIGLDRATRRLARKVDLSQLVAGLCAGLKPEIARYYTLVPYEDDARQFAFLDAVEKAGLEVITKRLPPKGVKRQVSMDVHMATDLIAFSLGLFAHEAIQQETAMQANGEPVMIDRNAGREHVNGNGGHRFPEGKRLTPHFDPDIQRLAVVVCPTRELTYSIYMSHIFGVETSLADFGLYGISDGWKGVDRWVDLSTSETIWRG